MFNLIVRSVAWGEHNDIVQGGRIFEYTDQAVVNRYTPNGLDLASLMRLPTVLMQESTFAQAELARVATITRASMVGNDVALEYVFDHAIPPIPNTLLQQFAPELGIQPFEFSRNHWAIKEHDLFRFLLRRAPRRRAPTSVFQLSEIATINPRLVSVMMPFSPAFTPIYAALQDAARSTGFDCRRADDFWENPAIIQDIVSLIDRSTVVICDCSDRNPNVFYEIGIAHTLGREVILLTQNAADIPFDLRHLRYIPYLNNGEGLQALSVRLQARLADLAA